MNLGRINGRERLAISLIAPWRALVEIVLEAVPWKDNCRDYDEQ